MREECLYSWCPRTPTMHPTQNHTPKNTLLCPVHEESSGDEIYVVE